MPKYKLTIIFSFLLIISLIIINFQNKQANSQMSDIDASQRDLIAVRILPNEDNLSVVDWYKQQGFSGSPQNLTVDGYEAIRDGRTVYVNAANIDLVNNKLYTNIYLISYNQDPEVQTIDIFGGIIDNWKFNTNLNQIEKCIISTKICFEDSDCSDNETCDNFRCKLDNDINCLTDNHCPLGYYCDSQKAAVIRDTKRLGDYITLKRHLENFYNNYNFYPILGAGSYVQYNTVSTWPSWQDQFLSPINANLNLVDPINSLGSCGEEYDQHTCFNIADNQFNNSTSTNIVLPNNSYVFAYQGNSYGTDYNLCASFETSYELQNGTDLSDITCPEDSPINNNPDNQAPIIESHYLQGESQQEFNGFIKIKDLENHPLKTVSITPIDNDFLTNNWSDNPALQDTNNPYQKRIYAESAGDEGEYAISIEIEDIYGAATTTELTIKIGNPAPFIEIESFDYYVSPNPEKPLQFTIKMTDKHQPITYDLIKLNTTTPDIDVSTWTPAATTTLNTKYVTYSDNIDTSNSITSDVTLRYQVSATDSLNASSTHRFNINLKVTPPILDFVCPSQARLGQDYKCVLGKKYRGDFTIEFSESGLPDGLELEEVSNVGEFMNTNLETYSFVKGKSFENILSKISKFFKNIFSFQTKSGLAFESDTYWVIAGQPTATGTNSIEITAKNDYNTASSRTFDLEVNTFCGDGVAQNPNTEARGGYYNDGYEDCDINDNVAGSPDESGLYRQYACTTEDEDSSPYPILTGNHCVFKDPLSGGGFCGDGFCQAEYENSLLCEEDCGPYCGYDVFYQGEYYPTVLIDEQCWFAKNLNVGDRIDGGENQGTSTVEIKKYCYDDNESNCTFNGGLYQWDQAMAGSTEEGSQGICPLGWHIPKDYEWYLLEDYLKDDGEDCSENRAGLSCSPAGQRLKANITGYNGIDSHGFSAFLAGYRKDGSPRFENLSDFAYFWTSKSINNNSYRRRLDKNENEVHRWLSSKDNGLSVRCVKNELDLLNFNLYTIEYVVDNIDRGYIDGELLQYIYSGTNGSEVTAIANDGYAFVKWYEDNSEDASRRETSVSTDLEFTAIFAEVEDHTVTYNSNGGTCNPSSEQVTNNTSNSGTTCSRTGNTLSGFSIESGSEYCSGFNTSTGICSNVTGDITIRANWSINAYSIIFNSNGGSGTMSNQLIAYGNTANLNANAFSKTGHTFHSWNTTQAGNGTQYLNSDPFTMSSPNNVTLYAQWTINTYTVIYDDNGSTGGTSPTDSSSPYNYNTEVTVLGNTGSLTKTGHTFDSWNTAADGSGISYDPADTFNMPAENVTLYAQWATSNIHLVTYDANGGTCSPSSRLVVHESTSSQYIDCFKEDYTIEYYTQSGTGCRSFYCNGECARVTDDITIKVHWVSSSSYSYNDCGTVTDSDGNTYGTVQIDDQCWMAENLKYLPAVSPSGTGSETEPHYYVYGYQGTNVAEAKATNNYQQHGVLYNWPAAMNGSTVEGDQGICPTGWHIPTDNEWKTLEGSLDSTYGIGDAQWNGGNYRGCNVGAVLRLPFFLDNKYPGRRYYANGSFWNLSSNAYFWSSSFGHNAKAVRRVLSSSCSSIGRDSRSRAFGFSLRCLKD